MVLKNPEKYNFYKAENELKKGKESFIQYVDKVNNSSGVDGVISLLKSSGLSVNLFNSKKHDKIFRATIDHISSKYNTKDLQKINEFKEGVSGFEYIFNKFDQIRTDYFNQYESIDDKYKVVSYLLSLEQYLKSLSKPSIEELMFNAK